MNLARIRKGDIVLIDKRGRRFEARVEEFGDREVQITPIDSRFNYFHAKSTEVIKLVNKGPLWKYRTKPK